MAYETIRRVEEPGPPGGPGGVDGKSKTWWSFYRDLLAKDVLTPTALEVLESDAEYLLRLGVLGAGQPEAPNSTWPTTRLRRGLAMGSVQSGKTSSMLAVAAKALDQGVSIVVVLAGTRIALWRQTLGRTSAQLDGWCAANDDERRAERIFLPSPALAVESDGMPQLPDLYFETPNLVRRMLMEGRPLIAVVMKHSDHLMYFGKFLHGVLNSTFQRSARPLHMLVIDDEADDGSILDRDVESSLAPDSEALKQIPRHIARLWSGQHQQFETCCEHLYVTYLGYTATPQANFLQSDHNPLSPTNFVATLRVPYDSGNVHGPRSTTFLEPFGIRRYYVGGELYYRRLGDGPGRICEARRFPERNDFDDDVEFLREVSRVRNELLSDALRAYFVGGALRLLSSERRLSSARKAGPSTRANILALSPDNHSMLYHPSSRIDDHFIAAREIADWCANQQSSDSDSSQFVATAIPQLQPEALRARLAEEEDLWRQWIDKFSESTHRLSFITGGHTYPKFGQDRWPEIRAILADEVFPYARLAIINSDPRADDRPRFEPLAVGNDQYIAAPDLYTIFVSGNVMARGITLEGLATTLFLRSANEPLADTQMQMQRWFGYRGNHLPSCRLFLFEDQLDLFRSYHEGDEALRREVTDEMNNSPGRAPSPLVLQGERYRATGKVANLRALPLCPGSDPFVRLVETGAHAANNAEVLARQLKNGTWQPVKVAGRIRGMAMARALSLLEVAELLESFRYSHHAPTPQSPQNDRWRSISAEVGLTSSEAPLYRPPPLVGRESVDPQSCPYSIAAYLRLWNALLSRKARGFYPTDDPRKPWSMIDLHAYKASSPSFYVGIRFGAAGLSNNPDLRAAGVHRMDRDYKNGVLRSTWGSRNPGEAPDAYLGDQFFDYHVHDHPAPPDIPGEPIWRPRGHPGLVLFHVIRTREGHDAVTVGLALPAGGPDHIAALRSAHR